MCKRNYTRTIILWPLLTLVMIECLPSKAQAQSRVFGDQKSHYEAQSELGYVVSIERDVTTLNVLHETLEELDDAEVNHIRRKHPVNLSIVTKSKPHHDNQHDMAELRKNRHVHYVAPLYTFQEDTVAITPEIILRITDQATTEQLDALCRHYNLSGQRQIEFTEREFLFHTPAKDEHGVLELVELLSTYPCVAWVTPNVATCITRSNGISTIEGNPAVRRTPILVRPKLGASVPAAAKLPLPFWITVLICSILICSTI